VNILFVRNSWSFVSSNALGHYGGSKKDLKSLDLDIMAGEWQSSQDDNIGNATLIFVHSG